MYGEDVHARSYNNGEPGIPVLSLILCSRNDQYMGNSRWRLETTLNYVAQRVHELGRERDVEVLVADWGSDVPLRQVLEISPAAVNIVSFILIPPEIARDLQQDSPFPEVLALNAAVRRARGEYIGRIDQDTLVGKRFLEIFFELYEGRRQLEVPLESTLLFANRRSIPFRLAVQCPPLGHVNAVIRLFGSLLKVWNQNPFCQNVFWTSYVGIWLLHRDLWNECGGYDERLIYMNWLETDMVMRLAQKYTVVDLGALVGYDFYHLEHYSPLASLRASGHRKVNPAMHLDNAPKVFQPNGESWGLINLSLEFLPAFSNRTNVEFIPVSKTGFGLTAFIFLLLATATQVIYDRVTLFLMRPYYLWTRRAQLVWKTAGREPVMRWPRLLIKLWRGRSLRILRQRN